MSSRAASAWMAGVAALIAGIVSVLRLHLANENALSTLVWAEDGLFPLCVRAHGWLPCLADPYAGYFLFLPRVVAGPVSLAPLDSWPLAITLGAAVVAALAAAAGVAALRAGGSGLVASALVALLPVLLPIMRFEAITVTASCYMLLIYVAAITLSFPPRTAYPTWLVASGVLVTALTMPSSVLLLLPLIVQVLRRRIPLRGGIVTAAALGVGLTVQAIVALTADNPRALRWSLESVRNWADVLPSALLVQWPSRASLTIDDAFARVSEWGWGVAGIALVLAVLAAGIVLIIRRGDIANGVGLLLLGGLAAGVFPVLIGYANNRYFVVPALMWIAAGLIALDRWVPWRRELVMGTVAVVLALAWLPGLKASEFRSVAAPEWPVMLAEARKACQANPGGSVPLTFTPVWPFVDAVFAGPTGNVVPCAVVLSGPH